jgi:hypothetical protein
MPAQAAAVATATRSRTWASAVCYSSTEPVLCIDGVYVYSSNCVLHAILLKHCSSTSSLLLVGCTGIVTVRHYYVSSFDCKVHLLEDPQGQAPAGCP